MKKDFPPPHTNSPLSKNTSMKRTSVSERIVQLAANTANSGEGGVTATPNTGQMKKLGFSPANISNPQIVSIPRENLSAENDPDPNNDPNDVTNDEFETFAADLEPSEIKKPLELPGITARPSRFSRTYKRFSRGGKEHRKIETSGAKNANLKIRSSFKKVLSQGWIPNQHGAYMMLLIPPIVGIFLSGLDWKQLLFLSLWIVSYFSFFSFSRWFKSGRKERYFPPVKNCGILFVILGSLCIALMPPILPWAFLFIPVAGISIFEAYRRRPESLLARTTSVISTGLAGLVSYDIGINFWHSYQFPFWIGHEQTEVEPIWVANSTHTLSGWNWVILVMVYLTIYFWSTIIFVKTLGREKDSFGYYFFSVASHSAILLLMGVFIVFRWMPHAVFLVWFMLSLRAIVIPLWNKRSQMPISLRKIGLIEIIICLIVVSAIFV